MKGFILCLIAVQALGAVNVEKSLRSSDGKQIIDLRNPSQETILCFTKYSTDSHEGRGIAGFKTIEFGSYESKTIVLESNNGSLSIKDLKVSCVRR